MTLLLLTGINRPAGIKPVEHLRVLISQMIQDARTLQRAC